MRTSYSVLFSLISIGLSAQITIGPADMPSAGDTVRYRTTAAIGIDPVPTEAGYIWDFSMLSPDLEGADTCVTVGSTPLLYQFYFNNPFLYPAHRADYAVRGQGFNFQALTVSDVYDYFKRDADGFDNVGFGANVNGVPASVRRIPVDHVHVFPMNYGDMDTSYSEFTLNVPSLFSFTQQQTRYNEVDGWGTLYLPTDTFEVLRVKSTLVREDSIFISQFGQGLSFPEPETVEYKWVAQGMDEPVLQLTTIGGQPTTARFYYEFNDISTSLTVHGATRVGVFPNPADEEVRIQGLENGDLVTVRNSTGAEVANARVADASGTVRIDTDRLVPGAYVATCVGAGAARTFRFVVRH